MRISDWISDVCSSDLSLQHGAEDFFFFIRRREKRLARFNTSAPERKHGGVTAIVQDHVAGLVARTPIEDALYIIPIFLKGLTLYGENGNALSRKGSGGVVLGRENITRSTTNISAQDNKRYKIGRASGREKKYRQ